MVIKKKIKRESVTAEWGIHAQMSVFIEKITSQIAI